MSSQSMRKILTELDKQHELACYTYREKIATYISCPCCQAVVTIHNFYNHTHTKACLARRMTLFSILP